MADLSELFGTNNEAARLIKEKIDELLGKKQVSGGVMNLLNTPANAVQDAHRERYLMDMFSGTNPDTGESFLEPTPTTASTTKGFDTPSDVIMNSITTNNLGLSSSELGFNNPRGFPTPATRDNAQAVLSRLSEAELADVMEILPQLSDEQYQAFIAGLENGSINPSGYEIQNQDRLRMY